MGTLAEISNCYREAAALTRFQLEEVREQLDRADNRERSALERRKQVLSQILKEMRDLQEVTRTYYTSPRKPDYTLAGLRAGRRNSLT